MSPWDEPGWLDDAAEWMGRRAQLTGAVQMLKSRDWSCVLTAPTAAGPVFMKAGSAATRFEPALVETLATGTGGVVLAPLAVDRDRAWMLLPDGGEELRGLADPELRLALWQSTMGRYAVLQREMAERVDDLIAAGVPDARLQRYEELLESLAPARRADIERRAVPLLRRLLDGPIPASIQHDDLHGGNILVRDGRSVVFDWGDACVSHPFMSLTVASRVWSNTPEVGGAEVDTAPLMAAYLAPWSDLTSAAELTAQLDAAVQLGQLWRAFTYHRLSEALPRPLHPIIDGGAEGWSDVFLEAA